jgi:hypothetical protein
MSRPTDHKATDLRRVASRTLKWADRMLEATQGTLLCSRRFEWRPVGYRESFMCVVSVYTGGVVRVFSSDTGELLAESKPGEPTELADHFEPVIPPTMLSE